MLIIFNMTDEQKTPEYIKQRKAEILERMDKSENYATTDMELNPRELDFLLTQGWNLVASKDGHRLPRTLYFKRVEVEVEK